MLGSMSDRSRLSELRVPAVSELDLAKLRAGRLARLQTMLRRYDLPVALLYSTPNIRYATGVDVMSVWTAGTFARYCLVPAEGAPILFEYSGSMHVSQKLVADLKQADEQSKNDLMAKAMMAMMPAPIKALEQEAESSKQFTTDGAMAVLSVKFNMSTLEAAIGAATQMAAAFGGGAGGPPGMQPMNPPGDQPKDRGDGGGSAAFRARRSGPACWPDGARPPR